MWKKIITMSLVLVSVLSFVACTTSGSEVERGLPPAQEIVNNVIESQDDIRTCQYDMEVNADMAGEVAGEVGEVTIVVDSSGTLDVENRQMRVDMTMSSVATGEDEMLMAIEMYLIGEMIYTGIDLPEMGFAWMKSAMPKGFWEDAYQIDPQIELLSEAMQVKVIGDEKIEGIDCYILEITPDMEQLWQIAMQQSGVGEYKTLPEIGEGFIEDVFQDFSVKQWIAKDTYFLTKTEVAMLLELTPAAIGFPGEEGIMTMDVTMNMLAYNYNQPVSIELPPEAEEAIDVQMPTPVLSGRVEEANTEAHDVAIAVLAAMVDNNAFELTAGGTVGPGLNSSVTDTSGKPLLIEDYLTHDLEAIYNLGTAGEIISAAPIPGGKWGGLYFMKEGGWQE